MAEWNSGGVDSGYARRISRLTGLPRGNERWHPTKLTTIVGSYQLHSMDRLIRQELAILSHLTWDYASSYKASRATCSLSADVLKQLSLPNLVGPIAGNQNHLSTVQMNYCWSSAGQSDNQNVRCYALLEQR